MGMDNGTITVWDLHRGVVAMTLGKDMQLQPVTDVAFSVSDNTLFSSSLASDVIEWDLEVTKITLVFAAIWPNIHVSQPPFFSRVETSKGGLRATKVGLLSCVFTVTALFSLLGG